MTAGAIRAGKAFVELGVKDLLDKQLKRALAKLKGFGNALQGIGAKVAALGAAAGAPFLATVKAASDLEETMNKFNVVFGSNAAAMQAWGDEFGKQIGLSKDQVRSFLAQAQDTFVPLGFDPAAAREMSKQVTTLAADLASFNNISQDEAFERLMGAMVGNTENLLKFGVVAQQAQIKAEALSMGFDPKNLTAQQKAAAIMNLTLKGTTAAQGDAARSTGSFVGQMKLLKASAMNAAAAIGSAILPGVTKMVGRVQQVAGVVSEWIERNGELFKTIAFGIAKITAAGVAILAIGKAISILTAIVGVATGALSVFIGILTSPISAVAIAGLGAAAFTLRDGFSEALKVGGDAIEALKERVAAGDLKGAFQIAAAGIKAVFTILWAEIKAKWETLKNEVMKGGSAIAGQFGIGDGGAGFRGAGQADINGRLHLAKMQAKREMQESIDNAKKGFEAEKELNRRRKEAAEKAKGVGDGGAGVPDAAMATEKASSLIAGAFKRGSIATAQKAFENQKNQADPVVKGLDKIGVKLDRVARGVEKGGVVKVAG